METMIETQEEIEICIRCGSEADGEYGLCGWCL
jgi:hypothetical protein